ncbi:hypothetical protein MPSEU_000007800 [Mayamaea pseudoterrestris]|nr:hypothetical protein MPSEU_000007800 [Mayamaea pseudoterrestris]
MVVLMRHLFLTILVVLFLHEVTLNVRIVGSHDAAHQQAALIAANAPRIIDEPNKQQTQQSSPQNQVQPKRRKNTLEMLKEPSLVTTNHAGLFEGLPDLATPSYLYSDEQVLSYAKSFSSESLSRRSLSFVHVPKTGGSSVENTEQPWGKCMFIGKETPPGIKLNPCPWQENPHPLQMMYYDVPDWHVPAHFFPFLKADPYFASDLFAVIRMPPMDRAISQYFWFCAEVRRSRLKPLIRKYCGKSRKHRAASVHRYFNDRLHPTTLKGYLQDHGHWIPQYDYVVGPLQVRYVTHVLQLEHMSNDYSRLGAAYHLNLTWPETRANAQAHNQKQLPSVRKQVQEKLADHFRKDWLLLQKGER